MNPKSAEAHSNLAAALNDLGNSKDAITAYEAAHRASPSEPKFIKRLGDLYLELDRHKDAVERFEMFLAFLNRQLNIQRADDTILRGANR